MNRFVLFLSLAALTAAASAQTPTAKPAAPAKPASSTTKPATAATPASAPEPQPWIKLPPGVPRVVHGLVKMPIALRYEDITVGKGAEGETGKLWHLKYTGWRAADGVKFDSWDMHSQPEMGPDGKPEMGPDGKPVMSDPEPIAIPQGVGRVIPGFDYGLEGMKIGGKRRIFIPWQMAYGTRAIPDRPERPGSPASPGIPAKSDLIFDVELVDVTDGRSRRRSHDARQSSDAAASRRRRRVCLRMPCQNRTCGQRQNHDQRNQPQFHRPAKNEHLTRIHREPDQRC